MSLLQLYYLMTFVDPPHLLIYRPNRPVTRSQQNGLEELLIGANKKISNKCTAIVDQLVILLSHVGGAGERSHEGTQVPSPA